MSVDVLAGANELLLQESTINAVSRDQIYVFNISPKSDSSVSMLPGSPRGNNHTRTRARMRNQYLNQKDTKNHPRYSKHKKGLRTPPAASILFSEDIHTRIRSQLRNKHVNEEIETEDHRYSNQRKGQKTPQASNFRILNIEDLYLTGSPFPPCPTSSIEDYDRAEGRSYDIDLRHISTVNTYSAQIGESESIFTATMYEGPAAYETWRQDFDFYANIRHPNVLQLFGITQGPIYALIFYSDIIPLSLFIRQCPPIALCYLQLRWILDRGQAMDYLNEEIQTETLYMQTRSGLLCVGPMGPCVDHEDMLDIVERCPHRGVQTWSPQLRSAEYGNENKVFRYIEEHLKDFHKFVGQYCTPALRSACLSTHNCKSYKMLGSVLDASSGHEVALFELSPDWEYRVRPWNTPRDGSGYRLRCSKDVYEDGWTRYTFKPGTVLSTSFQIKYSIGWYESFGNTLRAAWLAQARYISLERQIKPSNCVLLDHIAFSLTFSLRNPVSVERSLYLFVGPLDIRSNSGSLLESSCSINITPQVASYWSCDPSGESFPIEDLPILSQLSSPTLHTSVGSQWKSYQYKAIQDFQRLSNYDCNSRSFAEIHGFPKALVLWPRKDLSDEAIVGSPRTRYEVGLDLTSLEVEIEKIHDSASVHDGQSAQPQGQVDSCGPSECPSLTNSQNTTHIESVLAESESLLLKDSFQPSTLNQDISIRTYDGELDIEASLLMDMGGLLREKTDPSLVQEVPIIQVSDYGSLLAPEDDRDSPTSSLSRLFEEPEDIISISALC